MEAVHIVPVAGNVGLPVIFRLQVTITEKGRAEILAEAPCAAEIILSACAAVGREFFVAVNEDFNLALALPAVCILLPAHIGAHVMPFSSHAVQIGLIIVIQIWVTVEGPPMSIK